MKEGRQEENKEVAKKVGRFSLSFGLLLDLFSKNVYYFILLHYTY